MFSDVSRSSRGRGGAVHARDALDEDGTARWAPKYLASLSQGDSEVLAIKRRLEVRYQLAETEWRVTLRWWLEHSQAGRMFEMLHSCLSVLSCAVYVALTYETEGTESDGLSNDFFSLSELIFVCVFLVDYVLRLLAFGARYALSLAGAIDLVTTIPALVPIISDFDTFSLDVEGPMATSTSAQGTSLLFLRFLRLNVRILRALRFLRVLRTVRFMRFSLGIIGHAATDKGNLNVRRQVTEMVLTALSIIFVAASLIQILEVDEGGVARFAWHDAFYLTVVTISTVGYGDLAPLTLEARLAICFIIMLSIVVIPKQTTKLINMVSDPVIYGKLPPQGSRHLVVSGNGCVTHATISQFLRALYAADNAALRSNVPFVVLLHHHKLPREIKQLLDERQFLDHVSFVRGSPLVVQDLMRTRVSSCEACFVLGDPGTDQYANEDATSLMVCLAVRSYCHDVPMVVQLLSASSIGDLNHTLDPSWPSVHAVNVVEMKNLMLAKACTVECFCCFITNLLVPPSSDASELRTDDLDDFNPHARAADAVRTAMSTVSEYARSASCRLLLAAAPAALDGIALHEVSLWLHLRLRATLVAIKSGEQRHAHRSLTLNPSMQRELHDGDVMYLVCRDEEAPAVVMRLTPESWRAELRETVALLHGRTARVWPGVRCVLRPTSDSMQSVAAHGGRGADEAQPPSPPRARARPFGPALGWPFGAASEQVAAGNGDAYADPAAMAALDLQKGTASASARRRLGALDLLAWRAERALPTVESLEPSVCAEWSRHVILSIHGGTLDWGGVAIFAGALRAASASTKLLILTFDRPEPQEWATILHSSPANVHWMKGSYTAKGHLARANVRAAKKLVIFVPPASQRSANGRQADLHLVDQQAVLAYLHLDGAFGSQRNPALVELEYFENVRFLRPGAHVSVSGGQTQPLSVIRRAGELLGARSARSGASAPRVADKAAPMLQQLGSSSAQASSSFSTNVEPIAPAATPSGTGAQHSYGIHEAHSNALHPVFGAGRVFSMRALDSLLNHAYLEPSIVDLIKQLSLPAAEDVFSQHRTRSVDGTARMHARHSSCLTTLSVPPHMAGQTFGALFENALMAHGIVCLALVSHAERVASGLMDKAALPCVITCPPSDRPLNKQDLVYVLTVSPAEALDEA